MPQTTFKYDVFLSHSSKDKKTVTELAERLKKDGLKVWLDDWIIKPGDSIPIKIEEGLQTSRVLLLCMSQNAIDSEWVTLERHTILFRDPTNKDRRFLPILLAECEIPDMLKQYAYLDWTGKDNAIYKKLLDSLKSREKVDVELEKDYGLINTLTGNMSLVSTLAISPDGKKLFSSSNNNTISIWDLETGKNITTLRDYWKIIYAFVISPDGKQLVSGSNDGIIKIWDLETEKKIAIFQDYTVSVLALVISPDRKKLVSGSSDGTIKIWDLETGKNIVTFEGHNSTVRALVISSDGKKLFSGSYDNTIKIWDWETGKNIATLEGHTDRIFTLVISPDGKKLYSGSNDRTIKIWDLETEKNIVTFEGHTDSVLALAISLDGKKLFSGSSDMTIKIWDLETGKSIVVLKGHINSFIISPDGKKLISGSVDNTIKIWDLESILSEVSSSTDVQYTNAKIALVGESGVGKTGLTIRLAEDDWRATESTHGMSIMQLDLPDTKKEGMDREVWLWDFAGQPDYRLIHQLYMEETSLALLVIDPQKDDPLETLPHWEEALSKAVDPSPKKLLVAGRCDRGGMTISDVKINKYCDEKNYISFHKTEAKTGNGCNELKEAIANTIPWDDLPWTTTSLLFKKLKDAILKMKEENHVLMRFDSLKQRLQMDFINDPVGAIEAKDIRAVVGLLEGQGIIKKLDFGDWILLQPEQINNYASAIVKEVRENSEEIGHINKEDLLEGKIKFSDVSENLEEDIEKELLREIIHIFINRNICLQEDTLNGKQLVFPSYFKIERELEDVPNVFVTYTFSGIFDEIYATLIVRLIHTNDFEKDQFWKYAADFKTLSGKRLGLQMIKNKENKESVDLNVYFEADIPDDTKVSFIKYIHEHLIKHAKDVQRVRSYVCPECNEPVEKSRIAKRLKNGKDFVSCDICDDYKIPFQDIIEQKFGSDEFDRKVEAMDLEAQVSIDNESKELILVGHALRTVEDAGHIFKTSPNNKKDWGVIGEIAFKDKKGNIGAKKACLHLISSGGYLERYERDGNGIFQIENADVMNFEDLGDAPAMLVIRDGEGKILWMNITDLLKKQAKKTKSIEFVEEDFTPLSVEKLRRELYVV